MVTKLTPEEFRDLVDAEDSDGGTVIVDTRDDESFEAWRVPGARQFEFGPREDLDGRLPEFRDVVGDAERVVTVCAKGVSSANLAADVEGATDDYELAVVDGGMEGWSRVYERVPVDVGAGGIDAGAGGIDAGADGIDAGADGISDDADSVAAASADRSDAPLVIQVQRRATGCLGYVVGDPDAGEAVVVDPTMDRDPFEAAASEAGCAIVGAIDTHVHADHVSGAPELAEAHDVPYYLGERAQEREVDREFTALGRNEVLDVGDVELKALATPGHTTESISLLVDGAALLTADALHADAVGRTELEFGEDEGERGASMLYESLHRTLLAEPDAATVLPGHVTVESDGTFAVAEPGAPIGTTVREARTGLDVTDLDREAFVARTADAGEKPSNYETIVAVNRGARELDAGERTELEGGPNNCSA